MLSKMKIAYEKRYSMNEKQEKLIKLISQIPQISDESAIDYLLDFNSDFISIYLKEKQT